MAVYQDYKIEINLNELIEKRRKLQFISPNNNEFCFSDLSDTSWPK